MKTPLVQPRQMTSEEYQQLEMDFARCSGFVKMMTGVANNVTLAVMRQALNKIADVRDKDSYRQRAKSPHPGYRQKCKMLFGQAFREVTAYRSRLQYPAPGALRFFHVDDMPEEARKRYGAMTDREYFEFWEGTGGAAYQKSTPMLMNLWNKYRKSFLDNGVTAADQTAWGILALTCLELTKDTFERSVRTVIETVGDRLRDDFVISCYKPFSLEHVAGLWQQAVIVMSPETETYKLSDLDERNIEYGIQQLRELWISPDLTFSSTKQAVEDYGELFRSVRERKKSLRELEELRVNTEEEIRRQQTEEKRKTA